jgi:hypothetical protein
VDTNDSEPRLDDTQTGWPAERGSAIARMGARIGRTLRRGPVAGALAVVVVATLIGSAYVVGSPADNHLTSPTVVDGRFSNGGTSQGLLTPGEKGPVPAATMAPLPGQVSDGGAGKPSDYGYNQLAIDSNQIIKTGSVSLEVADIDAASAKSKAAISGLGGYVSDSNQYGTGDNTVASITFRVPSGRFDDAVTALRALGTKTLSMQTGTQDVTQQVVDVEARLDNLRRTEAALQAIMDKATVIADIIAVQNQLTQTRGEIEQLTAQRDSLKNQAAMSTLTATFQLPAKTVTTQATQDWTLSNQIDQAGAALVRIGQGLATMGVWLLIVVLPVGLAVFVLLLIAVIFRRVTGRGKRQDAAA